MIKVAINGFGRIGRPSLKLALEKGIEVVAINDLADVKNLAYLFKYDTVHGIFKKEVTTENGNLKIAGKEIKVFSEKNPAKLPWKELGIDVVLECTGFFTARDKASAHLQAGAKKVIISAPTKDDSIRTVVMGVNEKEIQEEDDILANASCTTNSLAPIMKLLDESLGIEKSIMSTVHSYTSTQALVDRPDKKDFRRGRSAAENIVPTSTGAAIATTLVLPQLKDNFDGMALRVPTPVGSISDITCLLKKDTTREEINAIFQKAAQEELKGILSFSQEPLVSMDIIGNPHSVIVQGDLTKVVGGNLVKVVGWYDNEWGYSNRLVEMVEYISSEK
jgi:glyceraldehyde 3-phosphate dehydrogenase